MPVKKKAAKKRDRFFYYLVSKYKDKIQLRKRQEKDIWKGLFDFPILEMDQFYTKKELVELPELQKIIKDQKTDIQIITNPYKQILSHQRIIATFIEMEKREDFFLEKEDLFIVERKKLRNFAFPKIVQNYLDDKSSSLFLVLQKRL